MMEPIDLLLNRRSCVVKAMTEPGPSENELDQILTAGIRVPDHGKIYPWRIQVLDNEAQAKLGRICAERFAELNPDSEPDMIETERLRPSRSPMLLVVASRVDPQARIPVSEQVLSGGALCQNLLNGAHALGYVAQWLTEWPAYDEQIKAALGCETPNETLGWIHIGSTSSAPAERTRATIDDVVTRWSGIETSS